ncbi:MAG: hypothetical protein ACTHMS_21050 [Jatrophihabitans sp.]|uniref:hypothetical protein n=1 Tax=Jatrophihabitans sp. TaxID=1932789 RepID=UPI003F80C61F
MSPQQTAVTGPRPPTRAGAAGRLIVLAVGHRVDEVAATWLLDWLGVDDRVHVVNVVDPAPLPPAWTAGSDHRDHAGEIVRQTRRLLGDETRRAVPGSVLAGDPVRVLRLIATVADVVVLGADVRGGTLTRRLAATADCTVVVVPARRIWRHDATAAVTAVLTPGDEVRVLQAAIVEAGRLEVPLRTVHLHGNGIGPSSPDRPGAGRRWDDHLELLRAAVASRMVVASRRALGTVEVTDAWDLCPVLLLPVSEHDQEVPS